MSKLLLIDDEEDVRYSLQRILSSEEIELATAASGEEGLKVIPKFKPDLVLMDVRMTGMTGMETLRKIRASDPKQLVILMTAYGTTQTAIEAMKLGAYDYLLKPFDDARFERMLARAKDRIALREKETQPAKVFAVKSIGQISFVRAAEIDWIEAADYYVSLHVGARTHLLRRSMAELEQELDAAEFCRIHRSAIVKIERVRSLELNGGGEYDVLLHDGIRLRMSRRYGKTLQARMLARSAG